MPASPAHPELPTLAIGLPGWCLRGWHAGDAPSLHRYLGNPKVGQYLADWYPDEYTLAMATDWVEGGAAAVPGCAWAIAFQGEAVGSAGIHPAGDVCNAELGYWLAERHWGQGVGAHVVRALTAQAFADQRVLRVFAPIRPQNTASQRICEKNGFEREGLLRMNTLKKGRAVDTVLWAMYRDRWNPPESIA